jgi:3-methyladenine DNA glycosylase AlkC
MTTPKAAALKEIFDERQFRHIAQETAAVCPVFDQERFLGLALQGLDTLPLMQRLRRTAQSLRAALPPDYREAVGVLRLLAPRMQSKFATLALPDFVGLYGLDDFDFSMEALKFFTTFGSSEFAVRCFLRSDLHRALAIMQVWSLDDNEHVRRLASEGSRPRLPWALRLEPLMRDPSLSAPIPQRLLADPSVYVRKSVANHFNDISRDQPDWLLGQMQGWPLDNPSTGWIAKRALRTLIKQGEPRALAVIGAAGQVKVEITDFVVAPQCLTLGERLNLSFTLKSQADQPQRLVIDYIVHYVKKSGEVRPKVFKLKELTLPPGVSVCITRSQIIRDFTTRVHYPGRHAVEIMVNGRTLAGAAFELLAAVG